jgi:mannose-6-phosphate isomerase-like protein (cupin superfamily)
VEPILVRPADGEGEAITARPERELRILCDHDWLHVTWTRHAEGQRGAEPHIHVHHVDGFFVLAGRMALRVGSELDEVGVTAGTFVLVPPGVVHGFDNDGPGELRFLNFLAPGCGFVQYLRGEGEFDQQPPPADGGRPASDAIVTPPGGGERFQREDRAVTILGDLPEISAFLLEVEPEWMGIPPHDHDDQVDAFFVLEGEAGFVVTDLGAGNLVTLGAPGSFYAATPGVRHGIENPGGRAALLNIHGPDAGFAAWIRSQ